MKEQQNFLLILRFWTEDVKRVFVNCRQKICADKSEKTSTFLVIWNLDELSLERSELSFQVSSYLFKFIGLLELWLGLPKNFLR